MRTTTAAADPNAKAHRGPPDCLMRVHSFQEAGRAAERSAACGPPWACAFPRGSHAGITALAFVRGLFGLARFRRYLFLPTDSGGAGGRPAARFATCDRLRPES